MALINCPHCGKPVSDKAEKCIHCGVTFNKENTHSNPQDSEPAVVDEPKPKVKSDNSGKFFVTFYVAIIIIVVVAFLGLIAYIYYQFSTKDEVTNSSNVEQFNNTVSEHSDSLAVYEVADSVKDDVINERMADEAKSFRTDDLVFFDLRGHVSEANMCIDWVSPHNNVTLSFSQDGRLQSVNGYKDYIGSLDSKDFGIRFMRNDKGRLVKACDCSSYCSAEYKWANEQVVSANYYSENNDIDVRYSYDNEGKLISIKTTEVLDETDEEGSGGTRNETKKIKYTKFDSKGNWIEREEHIEHVELSLTGERESLQTYRRIVSRTISYY